MSNQIANTAISNNLTTISVQDFMARFGYVSVVTEVRSNVNNYNYITFMNAANKAENIYFSTKSSPMFKKGQKISRGFFDGIVAGETTNASNEIRWKLFMDSGLRATAEDLF